MGELGPLISFYCDAPGHLDGNGAVDHLTIHDAKWAFCPGDSRASGHTWQPTGGATMSDLRSRARRIKEGPVPEGRNT